MTHRKRMIEIARDLVPPKGSPLRNALELDILDIRIQAQLRELKNVRRARVDAQYKNGASLQMDSLLREFLIEYNARAWEKGLDSMPLNFNVLEAFFSHIKPHNYFALCREIDHMFDLPGYLDFYTRQPENADIGRLLMTLLPENVIYSYNVCSSLSDMYFDGGNGKQFAVGGLALIRHEGEISALLLAGEQADVQERTRQAQTAWGKMNVVHKKIGVNPESNVPQVVPLLNSESHVRTLVLARIDLEKFAFDERYVLFDSGNSYNVLTDRPLFELSPADNASLREEHHQFLPLYDVMLTLIQLPLYFSINAAETVVERRQTGLFAERKSTKVRKARQLLTALERVILRDVRVIDQAVRGSDLSIFLPPEAMIEEKGYWKPLRHDEVGRDKDGNVVHGRTWVEERTTYARPDRMQKLTATNSALHSWEASEKAGFIYLMRCVTHEKDLFKIGMTKRNVETRAKELGSATGVPSEFFTLSSWSVSDCVAAEREIHATLSPYRVASNREFFRASADFLFQTIQKIVARYRQVS